jgi:2-oxoisovalerate dehydrogenase E2 component (dihydrolipoyl transacylase)
VPGRVSDDAAARQFRLPDLGEGLTDAEVVAWRVTTGDVVALNQVLLEVETEKAVVELPSPYAGRVVALLAEEGDTVAVGEPLIAIEVAIEVAAVAEAGPSPAEGTVPTLVGYGPAAAPPSRRRHRGGRAHRDRAGEAGRAAAVPADGTRPLAPPPVRFMARQRGVDLTQVTGHGPEGSITREDLEAHLAASGSNAPGPGGARGPAGADDQAQTRETRAPARGVRKRMAQAMVASVATAPQASMFLTIDATRTMELVGQLRRNPRFEGLPVTPLAIVARAVVLALAEHPVLNSSWDEESGEIVTKNYVNLGIAVAGPRGLIVPTVANAHRHRLRELVAALAELTERARASRSTPQELRGGTFTITNVGVFGVDAGTPILNPGEAGVLAIGAVRRRPWEHDGAVALREVVTLTLTFDHRVVDGEQASRFLTAVGDMVADPIHLLAVD